MGLSLKPLGKKLVDVFSADTEEDQRKRQEAGQARFYSDQQKALGNNRPATNFGSAVLGSTARLANTAKAGAGGVYGLGKVGASSIFGSDDDYNQTLSGVESTLKRDLSPNSGLLGAGTFFDDYQEASQPMGTADFAKKVVAGGAGVAGEVLPVGKGLSVAQQGLKVVPKIAGQGAAVGAVGSAGDQYIRTGAVDPREVALSAATGGVLAAAPPILMAGAKQLPKVAAKTGQAVQAADDALFTPKGRVNVGDQQILQDFSDSLVGANKAQGRELSDLIANAQQIGKKYGIDLTTGSAASRQERANAILDTIGQQRKAAGQGGYVALPEVKGRQPGDLRITEKLSPDRAVRAATSKVEEGANKAIYNASVSENPIVRGSARLIQGISREAGASEGLKAARRKFRGTGEYGKVKGADLAAEGQRLATDSRTRVWATIDTDQAAKLGREVDPATLIPEEQALREKILASIDETTQGNLDRGLISAEQASNPNYLKRAYEPFEGASDKTVEERTRTSLLKQFKGRKDVSDELVQKAITDPAYLAGKKTAQSHQAWAMVDYANYLDNNGFTFTEGGRGMVQLPDSALYGTARGKWVPKNISDDFTGFQYTNSVLNAFNDIITAYDQLGIRQLKKQILTVFNPAVRLGNQVSNRMFAVLNGHNPIEFEVAFQKSRGMIKNHDPLYLEAVQQGLTNSDITRADFVKNISQYIDDPQILKSSGNWFQRTYSQADDRAKLAAYSIHRSKGYSADEAARLTQRGFQDYGSVGFFYDQAAKMPLIGNAFVRFAGDSLRIGKNALVDHPLRAASVVATWATFTNIMSKVSGESEQDRDTREDRFGAPKLPFTDVSLTTQTPWGEVNVARFLPFYNLNEIGNEASRFMPFPASPVKMEDGEVSINAKNFQDPLLGQFAQAIADEDFRGKSIQDPEDTGQFTEELPQDQKNKNLARFFGTQNIPLGREADALISAAQDKPDVYGKTRSLPQAALRAGGVKVEEFGPEQAKNTRATEKYFDEKEVLDKELAKLPKSEQETYKKLTGYYKLRDKTDNEFEPGEKRYVKAPVFGFPEDKWKEYTQNPKIYDLMMDKKQKEFKSQGKPIQPEFDTRLSEGFRKQIINNKSLAPGEDVEADERMYSNPEWDKYLTIRDEYTAAASKYYPKSNKDEFVDELVKHKTAEFPKKPAVKVAYDGAYAKFVEGKGAEPEFTDEVKAARDQYSEAKRAWTNKEREARGLPPIDREMWENKSFGYTPDKDDKFGFGKKKKTAGSAYEHAVSLTAGGKPAKPTVSVKKRSDIKSARTKAVAKPKVSIKKSRV